MYPLNNATVALDYSSAARFDTPPVNSVFVQVNNTAIYYRVTTQRQGITLAPYQERFLLPGKGSLEAGTDWREGEKVVMIEFRSAVSPLPTLPAQVSAS